MVGWRPWVVAVPTVFRQLLNWLAGGSRPMPWSTVVLGRCCDLLCQVAIPAAVGSCRQYCDLLCHGGSLVVGHCHDLLCHCLVLWPTLPGGDRGCYRRLLPLPWPTVSGWVSYAWLRGGVLSPSLVVSFRLVFVDGRESSSSLPGSSVIILF